MSRLCKGLRRLAAGRQSRADTRRPNLEGVWSFATLTPFERPAARGEKPSLSRRGFAGWRDDPLQTHVGDEVAVVLEAVRDVERQDVQSRCRPGEELDDLHSLLVVHAGDHLVAVG